MLFVYTLLTESRKERRPLMPGSKRNVWIVWLVCLFAIATAAQTGGEIAVPKGYQAPVVQNSASLQALLDKAVSEMLGKFPDKNWKPNEIAATVIDLRDPNRWQMGEVRGELQIYPASVPKMFYMAAL